ncbi:MAG: ATP-binding cassette domain-containing protein, partial [Bacillota bacterium]
MNILEVKDLSIVFGGLVAVSNFNLTVGENQLIAIIGPNGAGKTTVFNMLTGIYKPTTGSIRLDGR